MGGFLNTYDFTYAGRDVVNQAGKITPDIINKATSNIDKIAKDRIDQVIRNGGAEVERIAPKKYVFGCFTLLVFLYVPYHTL